MNKSELARVLEVSPKERGQLRSAIAQLEREGRIELGRKGRYGPAGKAAQGTDGNYIEGTIHFPSNFRKHGFFTPVDPEQLPKAARRDEEEGRERLFVPAMRTMTAMHGDRVAVRLQKSSPPKWHRHVKRKREQMKRFGEERYEAHVVKILERRNANLVGTYHQRGRFRYMKPDNPNLPPTVDLTHVLPGATDGDKVVAELEAWDSVHVHPRARMTEVLGAPDAPGVDVLTVIHRYGLPTEFPDAVLREAQEIPDLVDGEDLSYREDWRDRDVFTIDPADARDFDDAICVTPLENGGWELAVHIADVSHYVKPDSALDREARKRGNSVYLPDRVLPMLPEKLSNGICSLKPAVDRLTHAVVMSFDGKGAPGGARFVSAVIHSKRRFSYEEAYKFMKVPPGKVDELPEEDRSITRHLHRAWELGSVLRKRRFAHGSLDLDFAEVRVVLDENGRPTGIEHVEYDESHQLIEEFMLAANEAVARHTKNHQQPSVYRVHDDADPDKLMEFADQARGYGYQVGDLTNRKELQKLLQAIKGKTEEHALKLGLLKSLKRAAYSPDPMGHYGLAKVNYTHFTSPIRRYADLLVHRVLRRSNPAERHPAKDVATPSQARLSEIADHISRTERVAADAEMEAKDMKIMEYLMGLCREKADRTFDAVIVDVRPIGAFAELTGLLIKGLIKKDSLPCDHAYFNGATQTLIGQRPDLKLYAGQKVKVGIARVDLERRLIDFELVER